MKPAAVVIGASAGGIAAVRALLAELPRTVSFAVVLVQHIQQDAQTDFPLLYGDVTTLTVKEAQEKEQITANHLYVAPPGYHLLIERDLSFSLSVDEPVHFSRPSIDVLFESAARAYGEALIGIVLTGASRDGADGLRAIKERGGLTIAQNPLSAAMPYMPEAAIETAGPRHVLEPAAIGSLLRSFA